MPHIIRKPGFLGGTTLAVFMTLVHTVNDAITAILGAMLPTLQVRLDAFPATVGADTVGAASARHTESRGVRKAVASFSVPTVLS